MRKYKEIEMTLLPDKNRDVPIRGVVRDAPSESSTSISALSSSTHFDDMDIQSLEIDVRKKQGFLPTLFNLMSAMLGAGILAIPSTFVNTGLVISTILLILIALLTFYATYIVISVARKTHAESFADLAEKTIGKAGKATLSALTLIFLISLETAYILIAGDILMSWFKLGKIYVVDKLGYHALLIFVYAMLIPIALTIPKDVSFLKYFSGVNVAFIFFYVGVIVYKSITGFVTTKKINPTVKIIKVGIEIFNSLSVYSLTFALPCIVLPILAPFNPNVNKRCLAAGLAMFIILVLALLSSVLCYLNLGGALQSNVLNSFSNNDIIIVITRGVFFFIVSFTFPLISQTSLSIISALIFDASSHSVLDNKKRAIVLLLNHFFPLVLPMFLRDIKPIVGIGGAIGGCIVNFSFPALMYIRSSDQKFTYYKNIFASLFGVFGIACGGISTYIAVMDVVKMFKK